MKRRVPVLIALLLAAQVNLSSLVPAAAGQGPPPWWVGGGILWPFFADTDTLLPAGGLRDALSPILGVAAAVCFLLAACALLGWLVPASWSRLLVVAGSVASLVLQAAWLSGWAVFPLALDVALLWWVFSTGSRVEGLRGRAVQTP